MNPKQRRGLLLMLLSAVGAVAVFLGVVSYVSRINAEVGPKTDVFVVDRDLAPFTAVLPDDLRTEEVPTKYVTAEMVVDEQEFLGQKTVGAVSAGARPVGVSWGYGPAEALKAAGAAHVVHHAGELAALI